MHNNIIKLSESLNTIKVYTILLVVLGHVLRMYTPDGAFPNQGTWLTDKLCSIIYSFHMPLFMLLSGCVYGICKAKGKYSTWKLLLTHKTKRILYPYWTFGIFVLAPCMVFTELSDNYIEYCIKDIMGGVNVRHLWYLLSLFEIFIIVHLIRNFLNSKDKYKVIISTLVFALIYRYSTDFNYLQLKMTISYLPYFVIGYYIGIGSLHIKFSTTYVLVMFVVGFITWVIKYRLPESTIFVTDYIVAISLIIVVFHLSQYLPHSGFVYNILLKNAMGIYLWYVIVLYISFYYEFLASLGVYIKISLLSILSLIISIILTRISRKLHFAFLLGESK